MSSTLVTRQPRATQPSSSVDDSFAPTLMSRLLYVAAGLIVLQTIFRGTLWIHRAADLYSMLVFSLDTGGLGSAAFFVILGVGLTRRKRLAWGLTMVLLAFYFLLAMVSFLILIIEVAQGRPTDPAEGLAIGAQLFNGFSTGLLMVLLVIRRQDFSARTAPGNTRRALLVLVVGLAISLGLGWLLVWATGGQGPPRSRLFALIAHWLGSSPREGMQTPGWVTTLVGVLIALSFFAALNTMLRSQRQHSLMSLADEVTVRQMLAENPADSLGYFATRRDKAVEFAPQRDAAVAYRAELGVSLAAGDPLGPTERWGGAIRSWLDHSHSYGWVPAVVGASEAGARAYTDFGMRVIRVGDEAILKPSEFDLQSRELRSVRQLVTRLERLGYSTRIRRHRDIDADEMKQIMARADHWRQGGDERGFSMALGRLGDALDDNCVLVEALYPAGEARGGEPAAMLSFVPWGGNGLSLDLMRRDQAADNGVTELMVAALMAGGREIGLEQVSLNFAVFRSTFEEGAQLGASAARRLKRRLLMLASRWFQIEQLYRSNVKYSPSWQPRFLCLSDAADIGSVGLAMGVAEGFIDLPAWLVPLPPAEQPLISLEAHPELAALAAAAAEPPAPTVQVGDQMAHRMATRERLLAEGEQPYPASFHPDAECAQVATALPGTVMTIAGRVRGLRDHGGVLFITLQDWSGTTQVVLEDARIGADRVAAASSSLSLGDHIGVTGQSGTSRNGTPSLLADEWTMTAKALRPLPDKHKGMNDPEAKVRQRYLDLIMNEGARHQLRARSLAFKAVRDTLQDKGFLEVETPILQTVHGGANARPFRTHINAYDLDLYLRIAPELFLKRLMVGGVDRVFEIGRNFRNEGADATHNPEFTMLEAYEAYGDYVTMREIAQQIVVNAAKAALGGTVVTGTDWQGVEHAVDLAEPWRVVTVNQALSEATGTTITADTTRDELEEIADGLKINVAPTWSRGDVLLELYEHLVEDRTVAPTFYCDFPAEVSPLTREHRDDPRLAERWDLVAFGAEIGTAYSELVDPVVQRDRLTAQSLLAAKGDVEAMEIDDAFLTALEYAMPPCGGLGMGMDRLVMMLTNSSIRETVAFPLVRPR